MKGEPISIEDVLASPPPLPRSSAPPARRASSAPPSRALPPFSSAPPGTPSERPTDPYVRPRAAGSPPASGRSLRPAIGGGSGGLRFGGGASRTSARPSQRALPTYDIGRGIALGAWVAALVAIGFFAAAQPPTQLGFFSTFGGAVRTSWDTGHLGVALALGGVGWSLAAAALTIDALGRGRVNGLGLGAVLTATVLVSGCAYLL